MLVITEIDRALVAISENWYHDMIGSIPMDRTLRREIHGPDIYVHRSGLDVVPQSESSEE
jgi:hypothetical protein